MVNVLSRSLCLTVSVLLVACGQDAVTSSEQTAEVSAESVSAPLMPLQHELVALPGLEDQVPQLNEKRTISMQTDAGDLIIEVYPQAAPNAAARFVELVNNGFYNETPVSRVVPGFVAQFGINWREGYKDWADNNFDDDPTLFSLDRGTLAFAKAGPDTNSTQVFINYIENNRLAAPQYNFTVFGKVVSGMEVVDSFLQVGDPGGGLDQGRLWEDGGNYLDSLPLKPTMIKSASVLE